MADTVVYNYTPKDFKSDQEVRWCPGCGTMQFELRSKSLAELGVPKEKFAFISGIGCSSRFPYYMDTYGFHSIHGRATAIATGVKTANPDYRSGRLRAMATLSQSEAITLFTLYDAILILILYCLIMRYMVSQKANILPLQIKDW